MFMGGTGSNHVLVMVNGIAINDQSTTQGLHDFGVDFIQTIQQIEVYQGPGAANFGSNAIGGAVNIITTGDLKDYTQFSISDNENYDFLINKILLVQTLIYIILSLVKLKIKQKVQDMAEKKKME